MPRLNPLGAPAVCALQTSCLAQSECLFYDPNDKTVDYADPCQRVAMDIVFNGTEALLNAYNMCYDANYCTDVCGELRSVVVALEH